MSARTHREAVLAIIIPWDGGLGVSYTYRDGSAEAGPIGPEDWPIIEALERDGKLSFTSTRVQARFRRLHKPLRLVR
jgi:hypothetical protein